MKKLKEFAKSVLTGGLLVILPLAIFLYLLVWLFKLVLKAISPLTALVIAKSPLQGVVANIVAVALLVGACLLVGMLVRTRVGSFIYAVIESNIFRKIPGYSIIKDTISQFFGKKQTAFSSVALVRIFGSDTLVTAFVTDKHQDGSYTVFVPTGPNPTSGNIYHLKAENVQLVDVPVQDAMRSIISCGAGSSTLVAKLKESRHR
jgi:uncharacterized membrane protein